MKEKDTTSKSPGFVDRIITRAKAIYTYCTDGVWSDPRNNLGTRVVKTVNLTLSAFFNSTLQTRSMSLTYSTVLSIVPAFALLVAIGRGFGLQDMLQSQTAYVLLTRCRMRLLYSTFIVSSPASMKASLFLDSACLFHSAKTDFSHLPVRALP